MDDEILNAALCVEILDVDRLLVDWRWLCRGWFSLAARNAFGDLFLVNEQGRVIWLEVSTGDLAEIASSKSEFLDLFGHKEKRKVWLAEDDTREAARLGLQPGLTQCVAFKTPLAFSESGKVPNNAYIADLYEYVSFLGDLNRQIAHLPDGAKIQLKVSK